MFVFFTLGTYIHWAFNFQECKKKTGKEKNWSSLAKWWRWFSFLSLHLNYIAHSGDAAVELKIRIFYHNDTSLVLFNPLGCSSTTWAASLIPLTLTLDTPALSSRPIKSSTHRSSHRAHYIWQTCCGDIDDVLKCPHNWARLSFRLFPFPVILCAHRAKRASSSSTYVKRCRCCCCVLILRV